jgi:hypothetical protein
MSFSSLHLSHLNVSGTTDSGERISFSISAHTDRDDESTLNITPFNNESLSFLNASNNSLHLSDLNISTVSSVTPNSYSEGNTTIEEGNTTIEDDSIFIPPIAHSDENHTLNMGGNHNGLSGGRRKRKTVKRRKKNSTNKSRVKRRKHKSRYNSNKLLHIQKQK